MTTAANLLREMQSYVSVPEAEIQKAEKSGINSSNNMDFALIVEDWENGRYDEDPDYVVNEIIYLF